ncbi:hypothetical protein B0T11DRAFT_329906 [Plectosphaerella cucumerina]|uniref:Essential protein Yae1 N-terminal domain-containing protein n=1 Tax=Plectosphaerella cucumerina TaxID=40658 RepID=A0A8K0X0W3_9PEZI|nr:hypothetical protein B0T11DRAFT_329906 [Plectosphaerella cucumerina]
MVAPAQDDPFDDVLNLEEKFYVEGYEQGTKDGVQAGKMEGRSVGMAKGFDKFLESGRLYGKAVVWGNRLQLAQQQKGAPAPCLLPPIANSNARLQKNVIAVGALVEPETLATENTDEAVNDFDDRVKRAQGKAKVVERAIGEHVQEPAAASAT